MIEAFCINIDQYQSESSSDFSLVVQIPDVSSVLYQFNNSFNSIAQFIYFTLLVIDWHSDIVPLSMYMKEGNS